MKTHPSNNKPRDAKSVKTDDKKPPKTSILTASDEINASTAEKINKNGRITIGINLDSDGKLDFDGMRAGTKEKLRELIIDPEVARAVGVSAPSAVQSEINVIAPETCKMFFNSLAKVEALVLAKKMRASQEFALEHLEFTEKELEELSKPTARIINKRAPDWLVKFQDEIALCMMIVTFSSAKIQVLREAAKANRPQRVPEMRVTPEPPKPTETQTSSVEIEAEDDNEA